MNTFIACLMCLILTITNTFMTSFFTKQRTLEDFKKALLKSKKEGKIVSLVVDGTKISISPKNIKIEVLSE